MSARRARAVLAVLLAALLGAAGCSGGPPQPPPAGTDPFFVRNTDHSPTDWLAAAVITDAQQYWRTTLPQVAHGEQWSDLDGGAHSVDTTSSGASAPPCSSSASEVEGNAYYCGPADAIVWDRAALLPVLRDHYGDAAVVAVLAHEMGHAVQKRAGLDPSDRSLHTESMADCYSGAFTRWVVDGHAPDLHLAPAQRDSALRALISFRDPVGTTSSAPDAHGTAFDRAAAFQDGYQHGPPQCGSVANETATLAQHPDAPPRPLEQTLAAAPDGFFADLVRRRGGTWNPPPLTWSTDPAARCRNTSPVAYCPPTIVADRGALTELNRDAGDHAAATLLTTRRALAAQDALHQPITGPDAARRTACLTGAHTAAERRALTPRDLDSTLRTLLAGNAAAIPGGGLSGFDRVAAFRAGAAGSASACGE